MSVIEKIMVSAEADTDVLRRLDAEGDNFALIREVDFHFVCPNQEKAEIVAGFLDDYQFGRAKVVAEDNRFAVQVLIDMPVTQNVIMCVTGFMTCIAELYHVEFDGWGCIAQNET